jgi:hypothetical protein
LIQGIGVFVAMTVSLCIAFSIAITGPPTPSEMASLQAALASAMRKLGGAAQRAGAEACERASADARDAACPAQETPAQAKSEPPSPEPALAEQPAIAPIEAAELDAPTPDLLGGAVEAREARAPGARGAPEAPPVRNRAAAANGRRVPLPPLRASIEHVEPLAASSDTAALADAHPPTAAVLREEELAEGWPGEHWPVEAEAPPPDWRAWPTENEQAPAIGEDDYYEDEGHSGYYEDPAYEEHLDEAYPDDGWEEPRRRRRNRW